LAARSVVFVAAPHIIPRHSNGSDEWMAFITDNESLPLAIMAKVCN
jgi:hypothetical protein